MKKIREIRESFTMEVVFWAEPWEKVRWTRKEEHFRYIHGLLSPKPRLLDLDSISFSFRRRPWGKACLASLPDHGWTQRSEYSTSSGESTIGTHNMGNPQPVKFTMSKSFHSASITFTVLWYSVVSLLTEPSLEPPTQICPQQPLHLSIISTSPFIFPKCFLLLLPLGEVISLPSSWVEVAHFLHSLLAELEGGWSPLLCLLWHVHQAPVKPLFATYTISLCYFSFL